MKHEDVYLVPEHIRKTLSETIVQEGFQWGLKRKGESCREAADRLENLIAEHCYDSEWDATRFVLGDRKSCINWLESWINKWLESTEGHGTEELFYEYGKYDERFTEIDKVFTSQEEWIYFRVKFYRKLAEVCMLYFGMIPRFGCGIFESGCYLKQLSGGTDEVVA